MEIADAEAFRVEPRWTFLKLASSDGAIGWGECANVGGVGTASASSTTTTWGCTTT
jgi:L-alanine-DL-glutamate epimerase-like enolase superfamily enzyme